MGSSNTKIDEIQKINLDQWQTIQSSTDYDVVRHCISKNLAEMRNVIIDPKNGDDDELAIYHFRKNATAPIVRTEGVKKLEPKSTGICGTQKSLKVLTQRIVKTFDQFPQLTFPESVYCLREALQGYRVLSKKAGPFEVNEKMMGINKDGEFKVWTNKNFGMNHPQFEMAVLETTVDGKMENVENQKQMVNNIISVIEDRNEEGKFSEQFKNRMLKSSSSFQKCQNELDDFIYEKKLNIPKKIHTNLDYLLQKTTVNRSYQYTVNTQQQQLPFTQVLQSQNFSNQSKPAFFANTQRITTEIPNEQRYQYTTSYMLAPQTTTSYYSGQKYQTPKGNNYNAIIENPNITVAESVYQKKIGEFSYNNSGENAAYILNNENKAGEMSVSNVAKVTPGQQKQIFGFRETRTYSQSPPPPQKIVYNAPSAHIKFSYGQTSFGSPNIYTQTQTIKVGQNKQIEKTEEIKK